MENVIDILKISGEVLIALGSLLGTISYIKSFRRPKARLRFSNMKREITLTPHYYITKAIKYYKEPLVDTYQFSKYHSLVETYNKKHEDDNSFLFSFQLYNNGHLQLEDYRVEIECKNGEGIFSSNQLHKLRRDGILIGNVPFDGVNIDNQKKPQVIYTPYAPHPLNQKDHENFAFHFTPQVDVATIELNWRIIAKDFSDHGKFTIRLKPYYIEYDEIVPVYRDAEIPEGAETVEDLTPYIQQFEELLKE